MAGGIYSDRPFSVNPKCLAVAGLTVIVAEMINHFGWHIIFDPILFVLVYVGLAWYDHAYNCSDKLQTGKYGPTGPFGSIWKPGKTKEDMPYHIRNVRIFHIVVLTMILYVAFARGKSPDWVFLLLGVIAGVGILYHGIKLSHYLFDR